MTDPSEPIRIDPSAIYDDAALVLGLGFTTRTIARERQSGRLKFIKRGRRILYHGSDVLAWLSNSDKQPALKGGLAR